MKKTLKSGAFLVLTLVLTCMVIMGCSDPKPESNEKDIISFTIDDKAGAISQVQQTISVVLPEGTDLTALKPEIKISSKAKVSPKSEEEVDFTDPTNYVVTAENGSVQVYLVTVRAVTLSYITILSQPYKTIYLKGETLDLTGLKVEGTYSDGSTKIETITDSNLSYDKTVTGEAQFVLVTVGDKTAKFQSPVYFYETSDLVVTAELVKNGGDEIKLYADIPADGIIKLSTGRNGPSQLVISVGGRTSSWDSEAVYNETEWFIDGEQIGYGDNIISINAFDYTYTIQHDLTIIVVKDGVRYSTSLKFTVGR